MFWCLTFALAIVVITILFIFLFKKSNKENLFWDIRSWFYFSLRHLMPYKQLLEDIIQKLEIKPNQYILDAGCGIGNLENVIIQKKISNLKIKAIDFSRKMLTQAWTKIKDTHNVHIDFFQTDLDNPLPYEDETFHRIVSSNVIYALDNPYFTIKEFYRILRTGGRLVLVTPRPEFSGAKIIINHFRLSKGLEKIKNLIIFPLFLLLVLPFEIIISVKFMRGIYHRFTKKELERLLSSANFKNIKINFSYAGQNFLIVANK